MKMKSLQSALFACALLACGLAPAAQDEYSRKTSGAVAMLPPALSGMSSGVLHLPGREFKSGAGWWALSCAPAGCQIAEAGMMVASKAHSLMAPAGTTPGQQLRWLPTPGAGTLLMFKPFRAPANTIKFTAGPVKTYYPAARGATARTKKTAAAEWAVDLPDGTAMRLRSLPSKSKGSPPQSLELQVGEKRQALPQVGFNDEYSRQAKDHVLWAGDLDGDGKPDLLVKAADSLGDDIVMLLSSMAKPGELVGEAGRFKYFPIDYPG
ncbi:hypothetical protein ACFDR9_000914 [Janthinobacterium sp. CG_23.3]|uniref:FG-GAP repeat protein n=1 Tax=Janthinobacterium sp. CG_23.3 TaxID=3349634 RepID=UPI0038D502AC